MAKTKQPTGLTVTRNNNTYTLQWKIADANYTDGQKCQYRFKVNSSYTAWTEKSISATATSTTITIPPASYYPTTAKNLYAVEFCLRGNRKRYTKKGKTINPSASDWSYISKSFGAPQTPVVYMSKGETSNVTDFSWEAPYSANDFYLFASVEWQSILVHESNETDGSKLAWKSTTSGWATGTSTLASSTKTITEDTATIATGSHTRWFRIRSRGVAGASAWRYAKRVFASPYQARVSSAKATLTNSGFNAEVVWEATQNASHPISQTTVEYTKAIPEADMVCPSGASWTEVNVSKDTSGYDKAGFSIAGTVDPDECVYVRVNTEYDDNTTYGAPTLAYTGKLENPSDLSISTSGSDYVISATNNSSAGIYTGSTASVKRLFLAVLYKDSLEEAVIGVIPTGSSSVTLTLPTHEGSFSIGARAYIGTYSYSTRDDGSRRYTIKSSMESASSIWRAGIVPPANVQATYDGALRVAWEWSWADATSAEITWADNIDAWESTDEPERYEVKYQTTRWTIAGIETGKTWYIRVRLMTDDEDSPYSEIVKVDLTAPPRKPTMALSEGVISSSGKVTASWAYISGDGTPQSYAEICEILNGQISAIPIAHTDNNYHITLYPEDLGWTAGQAYLLTCRVKSTSGSFSDWADPVAVIVAPNATASISSTSLETVTVQDDTLVTREVLALTEMPLSVTILGAGTGGVTWVDIERAEAYRMNRPDESEFDGYEHEIVAQMSHIGEEQFVITNDDLIGMLDDGAKYRIVATVKDGLGQTATDVLDFEVRWDHQAVMPEGEVVMDGVVAKITPADVTGALEGDVCDIYRLSADKPELIYPNAEFGETYVDPYPAIGESGGHRIVFKTSNGDYITEDNIPAWIDIDDEFEYDKTIIDFGDDRVELYYNVDVNHAWAKDFIETKYLGGSVQGDWNPAVSRTASVTAVTLNDLEPETINGLRRLAVHAGICHIRTKDGSSFPANVDVTEARGHDKYGMVAEFTLNITRVDSQGYDGMTLEAWEMQDELE